MKDTDVKTEGFCIQDPGDISVGIFPATWDLTGEIFFDDQESLDAFRDGLKKLFEEHCADRVGVMTYEEIADMNRGPEGML